MAKRSRKELAVVILAAGKGKRMKSDRPKVAFEVSGWPLVRHVAETARQLGAGRIVAVTGHGREHVEAALHGLDVECVRQREQKGTGHAVRCAKKALGDFDGTILVLLGDVPLVRPAALRKLLGSHRRSRKGHPTAAATILTADAPDPAGYGRVIRNEAGRLVAIREEADATRDERRILEVNSGIMAFRADALWSALGRVKKDNEQGEYYLTDVPGLLIDRGERVDAVRAEDFLDVRGVNSMADLAEVARESRDRILAEHLRAGVRIVDPNSVWIDRGVKIGRGTTVFPFTVITGEVVIGKGCEVGPFSHLRAGTRLRDGAQIGNFVEVKKSDVGPGTKAKHLTYLGDAVIGRGTNIGCGTITANYDGRNKNRTTIGDGVHVGSGTVFVAPVKIGDRVVTGAGAIVLRGRDVGPDETVVGMPARVVGKGGVVHEREGEPR